MISNTVWTHTCQNACAKTQNIFTARVIVPTLKSIDWDLLGCPQTTICWDGLVPLFQLLSLPIIFLKWNWTAWGWLGIECTTPFFGSTLFCFIKKNEYLFNTHAMTFCSMHSFSRRRGFHCELGNLIRTIGSTLLVNQQGGHCGYINIANNHQHSL